jgi:hypothetical protein
MNVWSRGFQNKVASKKLPVLLSWFIWKERNKSLFEGKAPSVGNVVYRTLSMLTNHQTEFKSQALRLSPIFD